MAMTTKNAKAYGKLTQDQLSRIEKLHKMRLQMDTLTNESKALANELIEEILKDKEVELNEYLNVGKYFIGVAQSSPSHTTVKSELEKKLIELGVDIEPMKKWGKTPDATLKIELTGKKK